MIEKEIIVDDLKMRYYQGDNFNKDKAVVFLHGWNSEALHLKTIFAELDNFIALDLPGFGKSDLPPSVWSVTEYAGFLQKFLMKLEIEKPILVGHSLGGGIIIKYLAEGGAAKKIILISAAGIRKNGLKVRTYKIIAHTIGFFLKIPGISCFRDKLRKKAYKMIDAEDYIEAGPLTGSYQRIIRQDLSEEMKRIQVKTVLIWGEDDTATPLNYGERMQELIGNSKLFVIRSAGHFSFIDQPDEFKKIFSREINAA